MKLQFLKFSLAFLFGIMTSSIVLAKDDTKGYFNYANFKINPAYQLMNAMPAEYTDVFLKNADLKDSAIIAASEKSAKYWSKTPIPIDADKGAYSFDFKVYAELNLTAYQIWNQLVECNSGNVNQTRINFYLGSLCANKNKIANLQIQLEELALNIHLFAASMDVIPSFYHKEFEPSLVDGTPVAQLSPLLTLNPHPLLVQLELQEWSTYFNLFTERLLPTTLSLQKTISYIFLMSASKKITKYTDINLQRVLKSNHPDITDRDLLQAQIVVNIMSLLGSHRDDTKLMPESCSFYGLWPIMNHHLMYVSWNSAFDDDDLHQMSNTLFSYIARMKLSALWSCRPYEASRYEMTTYYIQGPYRDIEFYSQHGYEHILETRKLFKRFGKF